ncbi:MAG: ABC transporter ATP-binding protein [Clostridia bacterium]
MVIVRNLRKTFRLSRKQQLLEGTKDRRKVAVADVSFQAEEGSIYGLLGPNGAGKTTTLRCISTLIKPEEGSITIHGLDVARDDTEVRKIICLLTNELKLDPHFTANYLFGFFGRLYGMNEVNIQKRRDYLFGEFGIDEYAEVRIAEMSSGMKQKLSIAISLVHDPRVVIFDEPTNGLDILTARVVLDFLKTLKEQGKTVIISTHIMTVAEKLCDKIGLLIDGHLAMEGTLREILEQTGCKDLDDAFFQVFKTTREGQPV